MKKRIILPSTGLILVLTITLASVAFFLSRQALDQAMDDQMRGLCVARIAQVESWIDGQRQNLLHWSANPTLLPALQPAATGDAARQEVN
ncbi:MAG TPA: hypothetical protein VNZ22_06735, partial [Bacillota bacterium]|nr:hypothetical protein [Bacillota bacterium]